MPVLFISYPVNHCQTEFCIEFPPYLLKELSALLFKSFAYFKLIFSMVNVQLHFFKWEYTAFPELLVEKDHPVAIE